jgi:hypothetical protein
MATMLTMKPVESYLEKQLLVAWWPLAGDDFPCDLRRLELRCTRG